MTPAGPRPGSDEWRALVDEPVVDPEQRISYINHLRGGLTLEQVMGRPVREAR